MDRHKLSTILRQAVTKEVPASEIDLWPALRRRLGDQPSEVTTMKVYKKQRLPRVAVALAALLVLLVAAWLTPPGRAFAESLFEFFTPAAGDSFPLTDEQLAAEPATVDEQPTTEPTVAPPSAYLSAAAASKTTGFPVRELAEVPAGFDYLGVRLYGKTASVEYATADLGGHLNLTQAADGYYESDWDSVPAEQIQTVQIGDLSAEAVQGTFVVLPEATEATWLATALVLRLRWHADGIYYELAKFGDTASIEYLDLAELIGLAEALLEQ